jgi:hypothetical protein
VTDPAVMCCTTASLLALQLLLTSAVVITAARLLCSPSPDMMGSQTSWCRVLCLGALAHASRSQSCPFGRSPRARPDCMSPATPSRRHPTPAAALVSELVESFPGFQDSGLYDGATVTFARKAQVRSVWQRVLLASLSFPWSQLATARKAQLPGLVRCLLLPLPRFAGHRAKP